MHPKDKKVLVAMSGGVDSSVAALLLKEQGCDLAGVTMRFGVQEAEGEKPRCCGPDAVDDARLVCCRLGIPHYILDYAGDLEEKVIGPFIAEYARGRTPNPCVNCNRHLKFGMMLDKAKAMGFDYLATGHYAAIDKTETNYCMKRPKDRRKDQTYFLYHVAKEKLGSILFPLAPYTKEEVRAIAEKAGLPAAAKSESQDICFVMQRNYHAFMAERLPEIHPGWIVDKNGRKLGKHRGVMFHTIGQRGGLGISHPTPLYVIAIDTSQNQVVVGDKTDLQARSLRAGDLNILAGNWPDTVCAKIRYRKKEAPCRVVFEDDKALVLFEENQEAITPGQSVVFYDGDVVLGGGVIEKVMRETPASD
ncbi:MAG: tRNA 2-thiouridine(34) synthase MnmA [Pseudomonadota bacterium]